jgi:hypothetical protein
MEATLRVLLANGPRLRHERVPSTLSGHATERLGLRVTHPLARAASPRATI